MATDDQAAVEEEARLKILQARRQQIRGTLKAAESLRNYRIQNDMVPELDPETGKPIKSDCKSAVTLTAFVVAAGAIALRVGGRAALISAVGLDFMNENPSLKENLDNILEHGGIARSSYRSRSLFVGMDSRQGILF